MFKITNELLNSAPPDKFPPHNSEKELAEHFSEFFTSKITKIRDDINNEGNNEPRNNHACNESGTDLSFSKFEQVTPADVQKAMIAMKPKSCMLDPLPTWLVRECVAELSPFICNLVNISLETGQVPNNFKKAVVTPLLKKKQS